MQVGHHLPGIRTAVNGQAVAAFGNALLPRQLIGNLDHLPDERCLVFGQVSQGRDVLSGDDKQVDGC